MSDEEWMLPQSAAETLLSPIADSIRTVQRAAGRLAELNLSTRDNTLQHAIMASQVLGELDPQRVPEQGINKKEIGWALSFVKREFPPRVGRTLSEEPGFESAVGAIRDTLQIPDRELKLGEPGLLALPKRIAAVRIKYEMPAHDHGSEGAARQ